MALGIQEELNITIDEINSIVNLSQPTDFFVNVNTIVFNGWMYFALMLILVFILYRLGQQRQDLVLTNMFYAFLIVTVLSLLLRGVYLVTGGVEYALISDRQLWFFPIVTALLGSIKWATRETSNG